jgi:ubiquinone/menaquinone biosynthesis C-methylase UbiE
MDTYNKTKENYNRGVEWHTKKSFSYNWSKQLKKFIKILTGKKVLDAGCGAARDIEFFCKNNIQVEGIDYSEEVIKKCRASFPEVTFYLADFRKMDIPDETYDGIWTCASVVNLLKKDLSPVLLEFLRVLKPGGIIFISVKEGQGERLISDKHGERIFSFYLEDELRAAFGKVGIKIIYSEVITDEALTGVASDKPNWICVYGKK